MTTNEIFRSSKSIRLNSLAQGGTVVACVLLLVACIRIGGRDDSFRQHINAGCKDRAECDKLVEDAKVRMDKCESDCKADEKDYEAARKEWQKQADREYQLKKDEEDRGLEKMQAQRDVARARMKERGKAFYDGLKKVDCSKEDDLNREYSKVTTLIADQRKDCALADDCANLDSDERYAAEYIDVCKKARESNEKMAAYQQEQAENRRLAAEMDAKLREMSTQKEPVVTVLSLGICRYTEGIASSHRGLAEQRRIDNIGGVVDLQARRDISESIVNQQNRIQDFKSVLAKKWKSNAIPCSKLKVIDACGEKDAQCSDEDKLLNEFYDRWLDGLAPE